MLKATSRQFNSKTRLRFHRQVNLVSVTRQTCSNNTLVVSSILVETSSILSGTLEASASTQCKATSLGTKGEFLDHFREFNNRR